MPLVNAWRFLHLADMGFQRLRRRFGIGARLDQPQRQLLQIAGERAGLTAGAGGGLAELVGQARQALMQAFDRLLQAVLHGGALQLLQPFVEPSHGGPAGRRPGPVRGWRCLISVAAWLIARLHFGLAALGIVEAAADVAQLFLDAAIGMGRFGFGIRQARQHRPRCRGGWRRTQKSGPCSPVLKGTEAAPSPNSAMIRRVSHSPTDRPSRRAAARAASRASGGMPATFQGSSARISNDWP